MARCPGLMRRSFTLIELLIVISIIGILVGMIVPVLSKTREKARDAMCRNNLRQLQIATVDRAFADEDGRLPYTTSWQYQDQDDKEWHNGVGWVDWETHLYKATTKDYSRWWGTTARTSITNGTIWDYTGENLKIYACPTFARAEVAGKGQYSPRDPANVQNLTYHFIPSQNAVLRSYAMNSQISHSRMSDFDASRRLLFADVADRATPPGGFGQVCRYGFNEQRRDDNTVNKYIYGYNWDGEFTGLPDGASGRPIEAIATFHTGHGNAVFVDGHVESLTWKNTTNACSGQW